MSLWKKLFGKKPRTEEINTDVEPAKISCPAPSQAKVVDGVLSIAIYAGDERHELLSFCEEKLFSVQVLPPHGHKVVSFANVTHEELFEAISMYVAPIKVITTPRKGFMSIEYRSEGKRLVITEKGIASGSIND